MRIAFLISGGGTTMEYILKAIHSGELAGITPALVIASRQRDGIERAKNLGIRDKDIVVLSRKDFQGEEAFGEAIISECKKRDVDFIGQYGWMVLTPLNVIKEYKGRIVNQHPGPLDAGHPDFGGKGMYGMRVHAARLAFVRATNRDFWSEATSHRVTEHFDEGAVVNAIKVPILEKETPETLQARVLPAEYEVQVKTISDFRDNKVVEITRSEPLVRPEEYELLERIKAEVIAKYSKG